MTIARLLATAPAVVVCVALGAAGAQATDLQVPQEPRFEQNVRSTWAVGYSLDEGRYVRQVEAARDGREADRTVREYSDTWRVGFHRDDDSYVRDTIVRARPSGANVLHIDHNQQAGALYEGQGEWLHTD